MKLKNGWNIILHVGKSMEYFAPGWFAVAIGCYVSKNEEGTYFGGIKKGFAIRFRFWIPFDGLQFHTCSDAKKIQK